MCTSLTPPPRGSVLAGDEREATVMILNDQVALVTGAGQGIGKACALALAEAGAHVIAVDINAPNAEATAEAAGAYQRRSLALRADVGHLPDIDPMVHKAMKTFGHIDILVNNAGVTRRADIMDLTEQDWDRIHRVNAKVLVQID
jgi:NAD(P)-dependent dehydrogenase (short-subunit alcohol dehydrogenase family)